jgi:fructose-1,6-bisphosphatase II
MDRNLALEAVRVTEAAALASARLMGRGELEATDRAGADAMRKTFRSIAINGVIVLGDTDSDLLPIGEKVGNLTGPELDVALDPLEGAAICAIGGYNAMSIVAIAERGGFLRIPEMHMQKIAVGPEGRGVISLEKSATENLKALADAKGVYVADLTVAMLERPRHESLIAEVREAGARVKLLRDGDVAAAMATTNPETGIDMLLGIGGSQQGIMTAAALRCAAGDMQARFIARDPEEAEKARDCGVRDLAKIYTIEEMASGSVMFAGTGVTNGDYLRGVRFYRGGATTHSVVMRSRTHTIRFLQSHHRFDLKPEY